MPSSAQPRKTSSARRVDSQKPLGIYALPTLPTRSSVESVAAQASGSLGIVGGQVPHSQAGGLLQKTLHASDVISRTREDVGESWDDDFASDISFSKLNNNAVAPKKIEAVIMEETDQSTLRPRNPPVAHIQSLPTLTKKTSSRSLSRSGIEDYSDIASGEDMANLDKKLANIKVFFFLSAENLG